VCKGTRGLQRGFGCCGTREFIFRLGSFSADVGIVLHRSVGCHLEGDQLHWVYSRICEDLCWELGSLLTYIIRGRMSRESAFLGSCWGNEAKLKTLKLTLSSV
jgi:hypothetical protein